MEVGFRHFLIARRTHVRVVGKLVHRQLAVIFPRKLGPYPTVAARQMFSGLLSSQSPDPLIHLVEEDAWVLSRGLLLVREVNRTHSSLC